MYYLIQKNTFRDPRYDEIFKVMEELNLDYEVVQFLPNSQTLAYETQRKDIFVYGSVKLAKVATQLDGQPGSFYCGNHQFEHYVKGYQEYCINFDSTICPFSTSLDWTTQSQWFIKPSKDAKAFTGQVFEQAEWEDFVYNTLNSTTNPYLNKQTLIQVSKPHLIIKEARIWIVDDKVVTSSYYKFHGNIDYEETVSEEGLAFAQKMAETFKVADAYVLDIALTDKGWKVVEVNCINSAGFYKGDVRAIIVALETFYKPKKAIKHRHFIIHKPVRFLSQFINNQQRRRNKKLLGELHDFPEGTMSIGRLDEKSEGLLLLTTDGMESEKVRSKKVEKEYYIQVDGIITDEAIEQMQKGVEISFKRQKYTTLPCKVARIEPAPIFESQIEKIRDDRHGPMSWATVTITEGKYRQVRKMSAAVGFPTLRLIRVRIGHVHLNDLKAGEVLEVDDFGFSDELKKYRRIRKKE